MLNMATKPRWCLGMLGTKRRTFGNIVGHVKGVARHWLARELDRAAVRPAPELGRRRVDQEALGRQADPQGHPGRRGRAARRRLRRRRADRLQPRRAPARRRASRASARCRRSRTRWARGSRCTWTAASAPARTCSRRVALGARGTLHRPRVRLRPRRDGRGGRDQGLEIIRNELDLTMAFCGPHRHRRRRSRHPARAGQRRRTLTRVRHLTCGANQA